MLTFQGNKTFFPDSDKCVEGAIFSVAAQLFCIWILDKVPSGLGFIRNLYMELPWAFESSVKIKAINDQT